MCEWRFPDKLILGMVYMGLFLWRSCTHCFYDSEKYINVLLYVILIHLLWQCCLYRFSLSFYFKGNLCFFVSFCLFLYVFFCFFYFSRSVFFLVSLYLFVLVSWCLSSFFLSVCLSFCLYVFLSSVACFFISYLYCFIFDFDLLHCLKKAHHFLHALI